MLSLPAWIPLCLLRGLISTRLSCGVSLLLLVIAAALTVDSQDSQDLLRVRHRGRSRVSSWHVALAKCWQRKRTELGLVGYFKLGNRTDSERCCWSEQLLTYRAIPLIPLRFPYSFRILAGKTENRQSEGQEKCLKAKGECRALGDGDSTLCRLSQTW